MDVDTDLILKPIAEASDKVRWIGIALLLLGGLAVYAPQMSGMTVSVVVGVLLIIGGLVRSVFAWIAIGWGPLFLRALVGVLSIVAGGYMIVNPGEGAQALAVVLVVYLIADGVSSLALGISLPPAAGGIWTVVGGVVSLLLGVLMWRQWPATGDLAIGVLIGVKLILDGVVLFGVGSAAKSAVT